MCWIKKNKKAGYLNLSKMTQLAIKKVAIKEIVEQ